MSQLTKIIQGSWKNKITSSDLLKERANKNFEGSFEEILDKTVLDRIHEVLAFGESHPGLRNSHKFYDMTIAEKFKDNYEKGALAFKLAKKRHFLDYDPMTMNWSAYMLGCNPLTANQGMFLMSIKYTMSDEQQAKWLQPTLEQRITGSYA